VIFENFSAMLTLCMQASGVEFRCAEHLQLDSRCAGKVANDWPMG
jgi:hypothetical protein